MGVVLISLFIMIAVEIVLFLTGRKRRDRWRFLAAGEIAFIVWLGAACIQNLFSLRPVSGAEDWISFVLDVVILVEAVFRVIKILKKKEDAFPKKKDIHY